MSARHTPGPWATGDAADCGKGLAVCSGALVVARVVGDGYPTGIGRGPQSIANAALIAEAPAMLEVLREQVASNWGQPSGVTVPGLDAARAILARIDGAPKGWDVIEA